MSDYDRVMGRPRIEVPRWIMGLILAVALSVAVIGVGTLVIGLFNSTNIPELTVNPHGQVVQIAEADGTILTRASDIRFDQKVSEIKKAGRYDIVHTGRLDGRP